MKRGEGVVDITPPPGVETMTRAMPAARLAGGAGSRPRGRARSTRGSPLGYVPIAGRLDYTLDPEWITLGPSWVATPKTYVEFQGETAYGQRSRIPFHVTSLDWQESDRVLAGIMTAFGSPTGAIPIGGYGEFDGVMLEAFSRPRIEGQVLRRRHARVERRLGQGPRRRGDREQLRRRQERGRSPPGPRRSRRRACSRSAIRGRTAARRSTRASG